MTEDIELIQQVKQMILQNRFEECEAIISTAMFQNPHSAVPHNLMGLLYENRNDHLIAMKHFRAAYALEPDYQPGAWNLHCFSQYGKFNKCAYFISDCVTLQSKSMGLKKGENN